MRPMNRSKGKTCLQYAEAKIGCVWLDVPQTLHQKLDNVRPLEVEPGDERAGNASDDWWDAISANRSNSAALCHMQNPRYKAM